MSRADNTAAMPGAPPPHAQTGSEESDAPEINTIDKTGEPPGRRKVVAVQISLPLTASSEKQADIMPTAPLVAAAAPHDSLEAEAALGGALFETSKGKDRQLDAEAVPGGAPFENPKGKDRQLEAEAAPGGALFENSKGKGRQQWLLPPLRPEFEGKKCLVLDLDETLIHSSFQVVSLFLLFLLPSPPPHSLPLLRFHTDGTHAFFSFVRIGFASSEFYISRGGVWRGSQSLCPHETWGRSVYEAGWRVV